MQGNIRYMYSSEVVIVARSLRSLAPLARKNLVQPQNRSDTFANLKYVGTISNNERKMDWF